MSLVLDLRSDVKTVEKKKNLYQSDTDQSLRIRILWATGVEGVPTLPSTLGGTGLTVESIQDLPLVVDVGDLTVRSDPEPRRR